MSLQQDALKQFVSEYPSQAAAARALKISRSYLNHILAGDKTFSERILRKIGLRRTVTRVGGHQ